jgi:hypothetical protein
MKGTTVIGAGVERVNRGVSAGGRNREVAARRVLARVARLVIGGVAHENRRVARPLRNLQRMRTVVRRRHRTWMFSMCMATLGWLPWWTTLFLRRYFPELAPGWGATAWIATPFAVLGFVSAIWCFRAKLAWILFTLVPLFANASLLLMPEFVETVRELRAREREPAVGVPLSGEGAR